MLGQVATILIAFLSLFVPGVLLSFVLLRKTELHSFEITVIGFIFGLIGPATMTWMESYLANYVHFFEFSLELFELNALILTIIGLALAYKDGILKDFFTWVSTLLGMARAPGSGVSTKLEDIRKELSKYERGREVILKHQEEERALRSRQQAELSAATFKADEKQVMIYNHNEAVIRLMKSHLSEEKALTESFEGPRFKEVKPTWIIWSILLILMLLTFYTRIANISISPSFFEFDPYFDMIDAHYILTFGHQLLLDPSAWPVIAAGTNHRIEPIVPYLEAYWYSLANAIKFHYSVFNTNLMSYIGSFYPPIVSALLVFIVFMILYHEYDERIGLIGAAITAFMPILISTFVAGEQLVEPWGIFALFFFIAAYMLAVRNMKDKRLAIFAGIAFVSSFLGAHYYTVTTGVLAIYILVQGSVEVIRGHDLKDFYIMNSIVLVIIAIFLAIFLPYQSTLQNRIPGILGIPSTISAPLFMLIFVFIADKVLAYLSPKVKHLSSLIPKAVIVIGILAFLGFAAANISTSQFTSVLWIVLLPVIVFLLILFYMIFSKRTEVQESTYLRAALLILFFAIVGLVAYISPLHNSLNSYLALSTRFTTASKPLFMTVQEYIPTGLLYDFGTQGFGTVGASLFGVPIIVWLVCEIALILILLSIVIRHSRSTVLYFAIAAPLMVAGFLEVKYMPHFGVAYAILFCIILGELLYFVQSGMKPGELKREEQISPSVYQNHSFAASMIIFGALYFVIGVLSPIILVAYLIYKSTKQGSGGFSSDAKKLIIFAIVLFIIAALWPTFRLGESASIVGTIKGIYVYSANPTTGCNTLSNNGNAYASSLFCNQIPQYWLNAMSWIRGNVGPLGPRILAWWDYGDWINWFGNGNAVLRGDNAEATEDYAVAAQYVLGPKYNSTPQSLAAYMNGNQSRYVLFDEDLIAKWGALDFLGCVNINQTSMQYAISQGKAQNPPVPYELGTSACEQSHDPQYAAVPLSVFQQGATQSSIGNYCSITSANALYVNTFLITGSTLANQSVCTQLPYSSTLSAGVLQLYTTTGSKMNAVIQESQYLGVQSIQGTPYVLFLVIYIPNANGIVENAPSDFYNSNYYRGFFTGYLPGFRQVYPNYTAGTNLVNFTQAVRIYEVVNYTGGLPPVPKKAPWITNNDVMP